MRRRTGPHFLLAAVMTLAALPAAARDGADGALRAIPDVRRVVEHLLEENQ